MQIMIAAGYVPGTTQMPICLPHFTVSVHPECQGWDSTFERLNKVMREARPEHRSIGR